MRRKATLMLGLLALVSAAVVSAGPTPPAASSARASFTGLEPALTPLAGSTQFENPPFTSATADAADPWGVGWNPNKNAESQLPEFQGRTGPLIRIGEYVYIGGMFHRALTPAGIYDETVRNLVRVRWDTGELDTSWLPELTGDGPAGTGRVWDFATFVPRDGVARLVVVGDFTSVDGNTANARYLAAFKLNFVGPPTLDTTMFSTANLAFDDRIHAVGYEYTGLNHVLYVGGYFTSVMNSGGVRPRAHLAKLKLVTGSFVLDTQWKPGLQQTYNYKQSYLWASKIIPVPGYDRVIIGGFFTAINNRGPDHEKYIAAVNKTTGEIQPWLNPFNNTRGGKVQMNSTDWVSEFPLFDMVLVDEGGSPVLYSAHGAKNLGVKWNAATGERLWYWWANGDVQAVTYYNGNVYFGFHGDYVTPQRNGVKWGRLNSLRRGLWAVSADGSALSPYAPWFRGVSAVATSEGVQKVWGLLGDGHLYVAGDFTTVNDRPMARFAIF